MKQYAITLTGAAGILLHNHNLTFMESTDEWRRDPANKALSTKGDDRSPAWTWLGYLYHDGEHLGIPSDNLMTMLRESGAKITYKGKETFKKQTQSGIVIDQQQFTLYVNGKTIPIAPIKALVGNSNFNTHIALAEDLGFELFVKPCGIGRAKHIRVRPLFRKWVAKGSITVIDEEISGLTRPIIDTLFRVGGSIVGLCDWRPSSPQKSGSFGTFTTEIKEMK